jgi:hypothetical protein
VIPITFAALVVLAMGVALLDWRRGWLLALIIGVLQDPARKLTPGTPVVMTYSIVFVFFIVLIAARRPLQQHMNDLGDRFRRLYSVSALVVLFVLIGAVNGLFTFGLGFWEVPALSLFIYLAPLTALVFGYTYANSEETIVEFFRFYAIITTIALVGTPLEYLKLPWTSLGMVAFPEGFIRHLPGVQIRILSGFYRAPDIMGWHAAMLTIIGATLALRARRLMKAWPWILVAGWGFLNCILSGRRKATYMVAVFAIALLWRYMRRLTTGQVILFSAVCVMLFIVVHNLSSSEESSAYTKGTVISTEEVLQRLNGGVVETFEQFGWLGAGLGAATQGVRHFTKQDINVGWQEGGLGKFAVELGLPGLLAVAAAAWVLIRLMMKITSFGDEAGTSQLMRAALFAIFIANVVEFLVSAQAYSDAVLTLLTAFLLGALLATARIEPPVENAEPKPALATRRTALA